MTFKGTVVREGSFWLAEIPAFAAMTQGRTHKQALEMIRDWLESMVNREDFHATVHPRGSDGFEVSGSDDIALAALLRR